MGDAEVTKLKEELSTANQLLRDLLSNEGPIANLIKRVNDLEERFDSTPVKSSDLKAETDKLIRLTEGLTNVVTTSQEIKQAKSETKKRRAHTKDEASNVVAELRSKYLKETG